MRCGFLYLVASTVSQAFAKANVREDGWHPGWFCVAVLEPMEARFLCRSTETRRIYRFAARHYMNRDQGFSSRRCLDRFACPAGIPASHGRKGRYLIIYSSKLWAPVNTSCVSLTLGHGSQARAGVRNWRSSTSTRPHQTLWRPTTAVLLYKSTDATDQAGAIRGLERQILSQMGSTLKRARRDVTVQALRSWLRHQANHNSPKSRGLGGHSACLFEMEPLVPGLDRLA